MSIITRASLRSGYRLSVRKKGLELELVKAVDDEIEIDVDIDNLVVLLWKCNTPGTVKLMTHKEVVGKPPSEVGFNEKKTDEKWRVTGVVKGDAMGLHWLWKMTSEKRMSELGNIGMVLQSQLRWAEIKLKDMDDKGWRRVAENLALNTGVKMITILGRNEFIHMNGCDKDWIIKHDAVGRTIQVGRRTQGVQRILGFKDHTRANTNDLVRPTLHIPAGSGAEPLNNGTQVIMHNSRECHRLRRLCKEHKGPTYPSECVTNIFEHLREEMHTDVSGISGAGDGLFIRTSLIKNQIVGVYEGVEVDETEGDYILEIEGGKRGLRWINADPTKTDRISMFDKMNEDLHQGEYNAKIGEDGFIRMLSDCDSGELLTRYGPKYNWDALKQKSLLALAAEVGVLFPSMHGKILEDWKLVKESTCALQNWVRKLIDGRCADNELHGIRCYDDLEDMNSEEERMMLYLTFGPTAKKFNFRHFGHPVQESEAGPTVKTSRSGRQIREPLKKYGMGRQEHQAWPFHDTNGLRSR